MSALFVWTFSGVMEAIVLCLAILTFVYVAALVARLLLVEWCECRRKKPIRGRRPRRRLRRRPLESPIQSKGTLQ